LHGQQPPPQYQPGDWHQDQARADVGLPAARARAATLAKTKRFMVWLLESGFAAERAFPHGGTTGRLHGKAFPAIDCSARENNAAQ
jgi:hypothetical protein